MKVGIAIVDSDEISPELMSDYDGRTDLSYLAIARDALNELGHDAEIFNVNKDFPVSNDKDKYDVILNFCFEGFGNDPLLEPHVAALFDIAKVPFTGADYFTLASCLNKTLTKKLLLCHGIPTAKFQEFVTGEELLNPKLKFPMIIKPVKMDGSIGIKGDAVVRNEDQLRDKVRKVVKTYKQPALAEEFIDGREIVVALMGNGDNIEVLPPTEFDYSRLPEGYEKICSYEAKWNENSVEFEKIPVICPANIDSELYSELVEYAMSAYKIMGCRDYARVDFRIDNKGNPYVLEVNPNCDPSYDAGLANMASKIGLNYGQLLDKIVRLCAERCGIKEKKKISSKIVAEKVVSIKKTKKKIKINA